MKAATIRFINISKVKKKSYFCEKKFNEKQWLNKITQQKKHGSSRGVT